MLARIFRPRYSRAIIRIKGTIVARYLDDATRRRQSSQSRPMRPTPTDQTGRRRTTTMRNRARYDVLTRVTREKVEKRVPVCFAIDSQAFEAYLTRYCTRSISRSSVLTRCLFQQLTRYTARKSIARGFFSFGYIWFLLRRVPHARAPHLRECWLKLHKSPPRSIRASQQGYRAERRRKIAKERSRFLVRAKLGFCKCEFTRCDS